MKRLFPLLFFFILLSGLTYGAICYQETATTATDCGGLDTGTYLCTGVWSAIQECVLTYDGNWDTYGDSDVGQTAQIYKNYTNPNATGGVLTHSVAWQTSIGLEGYENNTVSVGCWNATDTLQLYIETDHDGMSVDAWCWKESGPSWSAVNSDLASPYVYEGGIFWELTGADSCTYVNGDWHVIGADACKIADAVVMDGGSLIISDAGTFDTSADIEGAGYVLVHGITFRNFGARVSVQ